MLIIGVVQRNLLCLLLLGPLASANCMAFEEKVPRYALIIGNSDYRISP